MVLKNSKKGLNTGNTIRRSQACALVDGKRTYGYVFIDRDEGLNRPNAWTYKLGTPIRDIMQALPDRNVEYSLKKQQRWKFSAIMETRLGRCADSQLKMTMTERFHRAEPTQDITVEPCVAYQSNNGEVLSRLSNTEMQYLTAIRPSQDADTLSKQERRILRKAVILSQSNEMPTIKDDDQTSFNCHVTYGARNDGRLYKDACTRLAVSNCRTGQHSGKMEEARIMKRILDEPVTDLFVESDDGYDDDEFNESEDEQDIRSSLANVSLADLIKAKPKRQRRRSCNEKVYDGFVMV